MSLQAIRSCIRRLRVEKKVHTMVLMAIFSERIVLINHHGVKLAEYPASQVSFCGKSNDNKQFFGLVTTRREIVENDEDENDEVEEVFSTSCHVFMTEIATSDDEVRRRANAFQIEPTQTNANVGRELEYKEFPANADPIIETIENLYKKTSDHQPPVVILEDQENVYENVSPPPSSNSDSGIGFKDTLVGGAVGGVGGGALPFAGAVPALPEEVLLEDPEESFNTERLDSQNSADNLRQSMQRYLATKHQHLKKASEQLLTNRPSEFRQSLGLPPYQPPPRPPPSLIEDKSANSVAAAASVAGTNSAEPPQLYKSNLAKSHDELLSLSTKENQDEVLHPPSGAGSQPSSQGALTFTHLLH